MNGHYQIEYLSSIGNFLEVDGNLYNSIIVASKAAGNDNTINLIKDVSINFGGYLGYKENGIYKGYSNQTFNLNGHTLIMTQPITNYSDAIFTDTSENETGYLNNLNTKTIINNNKLLINKGNYDCDKKSTINSSGTLTVTDGLIKSKATYAIENSGTLNYTGNAEINEESSNGIYSSGTLNYTGGTINLSKNTAISGTGTMNISGGIIRNTINGVSISGGKVTISNEADIETQDGYAVNNSCSTVVINDGTMITKNTNTFEGGVGTCSYTTTINGGKIISETKNAIVADDYNSYYGTTGIVTVNGGTIQGYKNGIYHTASPMYLNGGTIEGLTEYGVYNNAQLKLGDNDKNISITQPSIKGDLYGLYIASEVQVDFYDGILKGKTYGYTGQITNIPERASIYEDSEIIEEENYNTNYLVGPAFVIENTRTNITYDDLETATSEAENGDTLKLLDNLPLYYSVNIDCKTEKNDGTLRDCYIDELKDITLDMNGYDISTNKGISLNLNLKIVNNNQTSKSEIRTISSINLLVNKGILDITGIDIRNTTTSYYAITNNGTLKLNDLNIYAKYGIKNNGTLEISNVDITESVTGIDNRNAMTLNNININASSYAIYNSTTGTSKINNASLSASTAIYSTGNNKTSVLDSIINGNINNLSSSDLTIERNTINGSISNSAKLILKDSTFNYTTTNFERKYCTSSIYKGIDNSGTLDIINTNIIVEKDGYNCSNIYAVYNTGKINFNDSIVDIGNSEKDYGINLGIYNSGSSELIINNQLINDTEAENDIAPVNLSVNVEGGSYNYAIYLDNDNSKVTMISGAVMVKAANNGYGVYINRGTFTLGEQETDENKKGTADAEVSTTNPYIYAVARARGYGVKKVNGTFKYYDGKIIGSTSSKPETTTEVEYKYEATTYLTSKRYEKTILEYMKDDYSGSTVARIDSTYYPSLTDAFDKAQDGDTIILLKNTNETEIVNLKNITLEMGGHRATAQINNKGNLTIINGSIGNYETTTIINDGTLTIGEDDGVIDNLNTGVISESTAIINNGTLNYYDGYIEGNISVSGTINQIAPQTRVRKIVTNYSDSENVITSSSEKITLQLLTEEAIKNRETDLLLRIDPNNGYYLGSKDIIESYQLYGDQIELEIPSKNACIFKGWIISVYGIAITDDEGNVTVVDEEFVVDDHGLLEVLENGNTLFRMGGTDVTIEADWEIDSRAVARIGNDYYLTLEEAFNAATNGEEIVLLKSLEQDITIPTETNAKFNLNKNTITGTITNNGTIQIDNGTVTSEDIGIINNGTLTLGDDDGEVFNDTIFVYGRNIALQQNGTFNFYDGLLQGILGIQGGAQGVPRGKYLYVDRSEDQTEQVVYLVGATTSFVAATYANGNAYYFNLQDAINATATTGYEIFVIRNFEAAYKISVAENQNTTINLNGYNVTFGSSFVNDGNLTLKDTGTEKGKLKINESIINNQSLVLDGITIEQITVEDTIKNYGELNLTNSTVINTTGYAVYNEGSFAMDETSILKGTKRALYNNKELELTAGTINGITNYGTITLDDKIIINGQSGYATIHNMGTVTMNNGKVNGIREGIYNDSTTASFTMNGGTITSIEIYGVLNNAASSKTIINNGTVKSNANAAIYNNGNNSVIEIYDGTITGTSYGIYLNGSNSSLLVEDGSISANNHGIGAYGSESVVKVNGGTITGGDTGIYDNWGSQYSRITINGGSITGNNRGIYIYYSSLTINGGTIKNTVSSTNTSYSALTAQGSTGVVMNNGEIISDNAYAVYGYTGFTLNGGTIKSNRADGIAFYADYRLTMNGGNIITTGTSSTAVYESSEVESYIYGGVINSKGY